MAVRAMEPREPRERGYYPNDSFDNEHERVRLYQDPPPGPEFEKLYDDCHAAGGMSRYAYEDDPKRLAFTAARYKHTAKLLEGCGHVLEVGCADGYFSRIVRQHVKDLTAIDVDAASIEEAKSHNTDRWHIDFVVSDIADAVMRWRGFDAVYALDVVEHISPDNAFLAAMRDVASVAVIGIPSLESQAHASRLSREGHVNCYSGADLKGRLKTYWKHVFMFTMHDEAIGTGYLPMANYLLALCVK